MAGAFPGRAREFAWQAARDIIAVVYCEHGDIMVPPLPDFSIKKDAQEAAKTHPGLCGVHHAKFIAGVKTADVLERGQGPSAVKFRNQVQGNSSQNEHFIYVCCHV